MLSRVHTYVVLAAIGGAALLTLPQAGLATSGGAPVSGGGSPASHAGAGSTPGRVQPAPGTVSASGGGVTIVTRATTLLRNRLRFSGAVPRSDAGRIVEIERLSSQTGWVWAGTTHGRARANGSFTAVWPTNHAGRFRIRAVVLGRHSPRAAAASPTLTIMIYKPAIATYYGPGFWGSRTACGQRLTRHMLGTANRTLKCGTKVSFYYQGRTIVVPVIDRGPYANGADWDLTEATANALHMNGTATVGAVPLGQ